MSGIFLILAASLALAEESPPDQPVDCALHREDNDKDLAGVMRRELPASKKPGWAD